MLFFLLSQLALAQTNLIVNGDFSKNPCSSTENYCLSSDASQIAPWKVVSLQQTYEIDLPQSFGFPENSMDLNSEGDNPMVMIQQLVPTNYTQKYEVSFSLNQNHHCGVGLKTGFVRASGGERQLFSTSDQTTKRITYQFRASYSQTDVIIGSTTPGTQCGPVVFNIGMRALSPNLNLGTVRQPRDPRDSRNLESPLKQSTGI